MPEKPTPSRPINLYRQPRAKRASAVFDRLDAIQEDVEALAKRRRRDADTETRFRSSLRAICLDLYDAMRSDIDLCVGVSRSNSALSGNADLPSFVSARQFLAALDGLIRAEYVVQVSLGTEASGQTTRVKGTQKLQDKLQMCVARPEDVTDTRDPIRLRVGKPKKTLQFDDDENTVRWRANLLRINANNARYSVALDMAAHDREALEVERFAKAMETARTEREPLDYQRLNFNRSRLHRVFNAEDWTEGGRFYGPWWQSVPREGVSEILCI